MTPHAADAVQAKLVTLRSFLAACPPQLHVARLVQYCGADFVTASDVGLGDVENQVAASMGEGFTVDWVCRNDVLYLRVLEIVGSGPSWERVFAEQDLHDVRNILRDGGFQADP